MDAQDEMEVLSPRPNVPIGIMTTKTWSSTAFTIRQAMLANIVRFLWFSRDKNANNCCPNIILCNKISFGIVLNKFNPLSGLDVMLALSSGSYDEIIIAILFIYISSSNYYFITNLLGVSFTYP